MEVAKLLVRLQDECDLRANAIATQAVKDFGLRKEHQKVTGNSDSAYQLHNPKAYDPRSQHEI